MTIWIRAYDGESDVWSYFELDDEEWALRHVDLQGLQRRPVTAASLAEVIEIRDRDDLAAMAPHERQYGVLADRTWAFMLFLADDAGAVLACTGVRQAGR